jgi:hypothetical protein
MIYARGAPTIAHNPKKRRFLDKTLRQNKQKGGDELFADGLFDEGAPRLHFPGFKGNAFCINKRRLQRMLRRPERLSTAHSLVTNP